MSSETAVAAEWFEVLHAVRVRGLVADEPLARATGLPEEEVARVAAGLAADGLLARKEFPRRWGWILTPPGMLRHAQALDDRRDDGLRATVEAGYLGFLEVNGAFKELCTDWQTLAPTDPGPRGLFAAELTEVAEAAQATTVQAAAAAAWFAPYARRIAEAVEHFGRGDDRYLISAVVDSVHTIWSECHEDFLVTLGRERSEVDES
jgi:hypothetical protein